MTFIPLRDVLNSWLKTGKFKKALQEQEVIKWANKYFQENKKWPFNLVKAVAFSKEGCLTIKCSQGVISSELRLEESNFKKYLAEKVPLARVNQIFYKIK